MPSVELEAEVRENPKALVNIAEKAPKELREYMLRTLKECNPDAYDRFVNDVPKGIDWNDE